MKTLALVVGNDKYKGSHALENAVNDAKAMTETFQRLGYEVIPIEDCNQNDFDDKLYEFENRLEEFDAAIFYFAGHGFQVEGENYLASIDCNLDNIHQFNCDTTCKKLIDILFIFKRVHTKANIVIIDACRHFLERGVSNSLGTVRAPKGTIIAFSTSPGEGANDKGAEGHSIYTGTLLKYIGREFLSVEELFKKVRKTVYNLTGGRQTSWEHTSLIGDFYFNTGQMVHSVVVPYDDIVVKDRTYISSGDVIDNVISDLKSCNWDKQNPAMEKFYSIPIGQLDKNKQFIIGRNILQASGYAHNASYFMEDLSNKLIKYDIEGENHLLNGILFEIYFDSNGDFRNGNFKQHYIENIFKLRHIPQYKKSFDFINLALQPFKSELFYIPSNVDETIDVDVLVEPVETEIFGDQKLECQVVQSVNVLGKDISQIIKRRCLPGTNQLHLLEVLSNYFLAPKNLININSNMEIKNLAFSDKIKDSETVDIEF
jgi:Uncharacterized protein containing caspase domain